MSKKEKRLFFVGFTLMVIVTVVIVIFYIWSRISATPDGYTKEGYECALEVLEAMDQYNNGELTKEEAGTKLDLLSEKIDYINSTMSEDDKKSDKGWSHNGLSVTISSFIYKMMSDGGSANGEDTTFSIADDLRKDLGK